MVNGEEIADALLGAIAEILKKEKEKAIQSENYGGALAASFFEGIARELKS